MMSTMTTTMMEEEDNDNHELSDKERRAVATYLGAESSFFLR